MKNNRLFGILYLLLSNDGMTSKDLAEYFEVSPRTIYRDVETLSELNIPIYMNKGKKGGIRLLENYKFDKSLLSDKEQNEILFSLEGINKLQIDTNEIYSKLKILFSKDIENWFKVDFAVWGNSTNHKETFENIKQAIWNKNVITFTYTDSSGTTTNRSVEPLKLIFKHNAWYLSCYDQTKNDYRFFKILRMKNLKKTEETFERALPPLNIQNHPPKIIKLVLEIDKSLSYRVYDEFIDSSITVQENGNFIVTTEYPFSDWVYGYLLSFGSALTVLEPTDVKEEIIKRLTKSLDKYL